MDKNKRLTPICIIYVDGERLGPAWEGRFRSIRVVDRLSGISGCAIVFSGDNSGKMDTETFSVGSTISVYMGYKDDMRETFNGEVATFASTLPEAGEVSKFIVTAASYLGQLDRNEQSRVFENVSPSQIVQKILSEYGLQADCESFGPVKERLKEEGMSDWKFILELARRYGRNIYCFGKNVYVKAHMTMHKDEHIYEWGKSLIGLDVTMSDMGKATGVQVISHDRMTGESFMGECKLENVKLKIGGTNDWRSVYAGVARDSIQTVVDPNVQDRTEAEEVAEAILREKSFDFIKGYGKAEGDAGLRAGAVVTIKYAGIRYDGEYIAEEVEHKLSMKGGYTTEFDIRRNMIGDEAVKELGFGGGKKASGPSPAMTTKKKTESEQITVYEEEETEEEHEPLLKEILSAKFRGKNGNETTTCSESEPLTLEVAVNASVEEDTEIIIRVYCDGDDPRRSTPLETLTGVVRRGKATVQWAHQQWLDEQRLRAERSRATAQRALDNAQSLWERRPRFFFTASSAGCEDAQSECVEIRRNIRILIDPGHGIGSRNLGTNGNMSREGAPERNYSERDLVLEFALATETALQNAGFTVIMTRRDDNAPLINNQQQTDLDARWRMGMEADIDAFISIHFNSIREATIEGTETFFANTDSRRDTDRPFATAIHNAVYPAIGTRDSGVQPDTRAWEGSIRVLRRPAPEDNPTRDYPRALIEIEFMSNTAAMNRLGANFSQNLVNFGEALANALINWFDE